MMNLRMEEAIRKREAVDVSVEGVHVEPGVFELKSFRDGLDYCDSSTERWIWSIGRHLETGKIYASYDTRFYENPGYECLFLR